MKQGKKIKVEQVPELTSSHSLHSSPPLSPKHKERSEKQNKIQGKMAYYTRPIRMKVSPLRSNVLN